MAARDGRGQRRPAISGCADHLNAGCEWCPQARRRQIRWMHLDPDGDRLPV